MKYLKLYSFVFFLLIVFTSCNKERVLSKKLIKGDVWEITSITIDNIGVIFFGEWQITADENIYTAIPTTEWKFDSQHSQFEWQFQNNGKTFRLNYMQLCIECDGDQLSDLDYFVHDISGAYEVIKSNRNKMEFTSSETIGYTGKNVRISISRVK